MSHDEESAAETPVDNSPRFRPETAPASTLVHAGLRKEEPKKKSSTDGDIKCKTQVIHSPRPRTPPREAAAAPVDNSPREAAAAPVGSSPRIKPRMLRVLAATDLVRKWLEDFAERRVRDFVPEVCRIAVRITGGTEDDYWVWMKIANRNIDSFMGVLAEFEYDCQRADGRIPRNKVAAFQARLNRVLPKPPPSDPRTTNHAPRKSRRSHRARALARVEK